MAVTDKPPEKASFPKCPRNPVGEQHDFVDMGILLGPRRWRCKYCYRGQGELRHDHLASGGPQAIRT